MSSSHLDVRYNRRTKIGLTIVLVAMFGLVKFTDESQEICHMKNITQDGDSYIVKYKGAKYEASLLASNETRQRLEDMMMNDRGIEPGLVSCETKKASHKKPKNKTFKKKSQNVNRKLFTEDSSPVALESTVLASLSHINSPVASPTIEDTPVAAPIKQKNLSYDKPTITNIEKISPATSCKLLTRDDSLIPKFNVPPSDIHSYVPNYTKELDEQLLQENISLDESIDRLNSSGVFEVVIAETDGSSYVEPSYEVEFDSYRNLKKDLVNDIHFNTLMHESASSILMQANGNDSDINSSLGKFESMLDSTGLFPSEELLTSTPDHIISDLTPNMENKINLIESDARPPIELVLEVPHHSAALSDGDLSDNRPDDPSYEPQIENSSDSESDAENRADENANYKVLKNETYTKDKSNVSSGMDVSASVSISGSRAMDDDDMQVQKSQGRNGDKKFNFCFFCHKKQSKIARHLELKHGDKEEVKKFVVLPKKSSERRQIIDIIRKKGNFLFNTQSDYNDGELIVSRRPNTKFDRTARNFKACANCKAFFAVSSLRVHFSKCTGRSSKSTRLVMVMGKKVVRRIHSRATQEVSAVLFPPMREDEVVRGIRYDELVIVYANKMCQKYGDRRYYDMIRQRIRLLGRFLLTLRKVNKDVTDLTSIYDPKFCDDVLEAINIEAKLGVVSANSYQTPSVASNLGTLLKQIGSILINECIKKHYDAKKKCVKDFLKLLVQEVTISINRRVGESQAQHNRRKKVELPSMEDIKKLVTYLSQKRNEAFEKLSDTFSEKEWTNLAETTLTSIQIFNRRRAGEIERTLIEDFESHHTLDIDTDKDLFNSLSKQSQEIAKKYFRFTIRGKLNRTVPVLIDTHIFESIQLLLHHRNNMKIREKNPYVFGVPGADKSRYKYLRACALLRKFSVECGAANPERLRGTILRKHIATTCISLNLSENEVTDLANFMGHAEKIHKDIYRQPLVNREILQMSKLLEAAQGAGDANEDDEHETDESDDELENIDQEPGTKSIYEKSQNKEFTSSLKRKRSTSPYGSVKRTPWNADEKTTVLRIFSENLIKNKLPSLHQIQEAIIQNPCLKNRTPPQIKTWLHNQTKTKKKLCFEDNV